MPYKNLPNLNIDYTSPYSHLAIRLLTYPKGGADDVFGSETILVVEDAEAIRKMVCAMLAQQGYQCLEAADGIDALRMLEETSGPIDLVLTDVVMPKMTGVDLGKSLGLLRPELPIVFMSGYSDDPMIRSFERIPPIFLAKPFTATSLLEKVRQALDRPWAGLSNIVNSAQ